MSMGTDVTESVIQALSQALFDLHAFNVCTVFAVLIQVLTLVHSSSFLVCLMPLLKALFEHRTLLSRSVGFYPV